jgi:diguanylate cyclase (GGDEF)-like protein/PAS domain S-box-containing protein
MDKQTNYYKANSSEDLLILINTEGIISEVSPICSEILEYSEVELLNTSFSKYFGFTINDPSISLKTKAEALSKNGTKLYFDVAVRPLLGDNAEVVGSRLSLRDVTHYVEIESSYTSLVDTIEKSKDLLFKYQLKPEMKFIYVSPSIERVLGHSHSDFYTDPQLVFNIVHPEDAHIQQGKIDKNSDFSNVFEVRHRHKDGHYVWIEDYIIPEFDKDTGELISVVGMSRDITERKNLEEKLHELEKLSYKDALTGLNNRAYLNKQLQDLINKANTPIGVVVCDLDNLKYINDNFGHSAGDAMLIAVSSFFSNYFGKNFSIIRAGGDEFITLLPDVSAEEFKSIYTEMLRALEEYNKSNNTNIQLSSGCAYSLSSNNILELLSLADKNMYKNKYSRKVSS